MRISKNTILAFFCGGFWGWIATVLERADIISTVEWIFLWLSGCILIGVASAFVKLRE